MKLVETRGRIAEDGSIVLMPGVLERLDTKVGETICLTYLADKNVKSSNTYCSLLLTKGGVETLTEPFDPADETEIVIPHVLLEEADIPVEGEISIQCGPGIILISSADPLDAVPLALMNLFDELDIDHDTIRTVLKEGGF